MLNLGHLIFFQGHQVMFVPCNDGSNIDFRDVSQWEEQLFSVRSLQICLAPAGAEPSAPEGVSGWVVAPPAGGCSCGVSHHEVGMGSPAPSASQATCPGFSVSRDHSKAKKHIRALGPSLIWRLKIMQRFLEKEKIKIKPPPHLKETCPFKKGLNIIYFQRTRDRLRIAGTFSLTQIYIIVLNFSPFLPIILFLSL